VHGFKMLNNDNFECDFFDSSLVDFFDKFSQLRQSWVKKRLALNEFTFWWSFCTGSKVSQKVSMLECMMAAPISSKVYVTTLQIWPGICQFINNTIDISL
jgi:hypothetical protein